MERTLIDDANVPFFKISTTAKDRNTRSNTYVIPNNHVLYARRNMIEAANGAIMANRYISTLSLNHRERLDDRPFTKRDLT